ncbi:MAG: glycogen synthase GlgA [Planctomycetes bacterium]|nr:glycogen synthase GlgA [Planctomycetota bacterium]
MNIVEIVPEIVPFSKTGGLADVAGALPDHLEALGATVLVITPLYRCVPAQAVERLDTAFKVSLGARTLDVRVARATLPGRGVPVYFIDVPEFYDRDHLYGPPGRDDPDNAARFALLSRAALELVKSLKFEPEVFHVHDWQAGLVPVYVQTTHALWFPNSKSVLTLHNLAYQGLFPPSALAMTGLDAGLFNWRQLEFYGKVSYLKGGIVFADAVTTVSPTYAREIQTPELGCGFDGILRERADRIFGILNGVDDREWNPQRDPYLKERYSANSLKGKGACKRELQSRLQLIERADVPLFGFVGRLVEQKGIDLLCSAMEILVRKDLQIALLGTGDPRYEEMLRRIAGRHPRQVAVRLEFDNELAHLVEGGADAFVMPSRYEPCGLNQLYSLKYGTLPVARRTGGLADTIVDATPQNLEAGKATGFLFDDYTAEALVAAIDRTLACWRNRTSWTRMMKTAMKQDFSWEASAKRYMELFRSLAPGVG